MSSRPHTPTRPWHGRTVSSGSVNNNNYTPSSSRRRRSSAAGYSPQTPRLSRNFDMQNSPSQHDAYGDYNPEDTHEHAVARGGDGGLGNLADELGDSWDEDEEGADDGDDDIGPLGEDDDEDEDEDEDDINERLNGGAIIAEASRDSGVALDRSSPISKASSLSPDFSRGHTPLSRRHKRVGSMYDGSDYGDSSDLESNEGLTPGLEKQMAAVESLVRRGVEANGSDNDCVVERVTDKLRDLGSQSGVESGATRLTTAHTALSTHITHQTRHLLSLNSTIFSPLAPPLAPDLVEPIIPLISDTLAAIPHPTYSTLNSLITLSHSTHELLDTLSLLSDTLHMSRQASLSATRRLRSVKEQLAEWKREQEAAEEGRIYLERGEWDKKLREREAGKVCGDVVGGFEAACEGWRQKLVATLEAC